VTDSIDRDFVLPAGQVLSSIDQEALVLDGSSWRSLTLNGVVNVSTTTGHHPTKGISAYSTDSNPTVSIGAAGELHVHESGGLAFASGLIMYTSGATRAGLLNLGLIEVRGEDEAWGVSAYGGVNVDNRGSITVNGAAGGFGLVLQTGASLTNSGTIEITGARTRFQGATAVMIDNSSTGRGGDFQNSGTIRAHHIDAAAPSVGVLTHGIGTFSNSGLIEGDKSLKLVGGIGQTPTPHLFTNAGTLRGDVDMTYSDGGSITIANSGWIEGAVTFGGETDVYDGHGGVLLGVLHAEGGADSLVGGAQAETLFGDAGDDTVSGGGGADLLDGGDGVDTLSFIGAAGARLDVGAQTASTGATFSHFERYEGGAAADTMVGSASGDSLAGGGGNDVINGGQGDDAISEISGASYLRGDDGSDSISGGRDFDDINGNAGADTAHGNDGDDWVVGGKDSDLLFGDNGFDVVYGNLGDDTVSGGDGADWVRGGQGADSVSGGAGDDLIWGDRGDDTISGGTGADVFHSFSGTGLDRVIDFSPAEGDRVQLDPGTTYSIRQVGADTVIDLGGGDQVVLVGIQASTLTAASIFVG
jgi:Ca2+-binding RTX toxin-like protein